MQGDQPNTHVPTWLAWVLPLAVPIAAVLAGPWTATVAALAASAAAFSVVFALGRALERARDRAVSIQDQLIQSQKMASIGQLASGIAHEVNTPLMVIGQDVELLEMVLAAGNMPEKMHAEAESCLEGIRRQVDRCGEITHKLLGFARKSDTVAQRIDANALVEDMVMLVEREAKRQGIVMQREYGQVPEVDTDPPLLRQIILNLLNNAAQAVGRDGVVRVSTRNASGRLEIAVQDTGPGIEPEVMDRLFDPFFTTKPPGQGTGLGLSTSLYIANRLGGTITAANAPNGGALFTVRLPLDAAAPAAAKAA